MASRMVNRFDLRRQADAEASLDVTEPDVPAGMEHWLGVRRSDLKRLRKSIEAGLVGKDKLETILPVLRVARWRPETLPHMKIALDRFFGWLQERMKNDPRRRLES